MIDIKRLGTTKLLLFLALLFAGTMSASAITFASRSSGAGIGGTWNSEQLSTSQVGHAPIYIDGNASLDAFCAGNGTNGLSWATAYVIENLAINGNGGTCISITNTNRYLIIRDCDLSSPGFIGSSSRQAIGLFSVQHVKILSNYVHDVSNGSIILGIYSTGIYVSMSSDVNISSNQFVRCLEASIYIVNSRNIETSNNYVAYTFGGIFSGALSCYLDTNLIISDNTFVNITTFGELSCGGVNDSTIEGNMLYGPSIYGILMGSTEAGTGVVYGYNITANIDYNDVVRNNYISTVYAGIGIGVAYNISVKNNTMFNCGIGFLPQPNPLFGSYSLSPPSPPFPIAAITSTEIDTSNTINGNPVYFYKNSINLTPADFVGAGEVILANCNGSTISNLIIPSASIEAIQLIYSNGNTITGNTLTNQYGAAINLAGSNGNTIINNTVKSSLKFGISTIFSNQNVIASNVISGCGSVGISIIEASNGSTVTKNTVENTTGYAMNVDGINNKIYYNSFIDNNGSGVQAFDYTGGNSWDDGVGQGNYWSDYASRYPTATNNGIAWNMPYVLDGNGQDNYPLVNHYQANPVVATITEVQVDLGNINQLAISQLTGGTRSAVQAHVANALAMLATIQQAYQATGKIPHGQVNALLQQVKNIDKKANDPAITSICNEIRAAIATLP
ncbi:MAG TPA: right-handed parallel beta-helix repeat-containing protein [Candidatus Lokiarchaeia archaeon]|nr:right-handed parallel beta-helix repeat-containing protein [Candidatus Lokiarchaeia archaeon]